MPGSSHAQDYVDAFEKLLHVTSRQAQSQREAVHIVFKLCLGERTFNEFYAHLLDKLCDHHRQLKVLLIVIMVVLCNRADHYIFAL